MKTNATTPLTDARMLAAGAILLLVAIDRDDLSAADRVEAVNELLSEEGDESPEPARKHPSRYQACKIAA